MGKAWISVGFVVALVAAPTAAAQPPANAAEVVFLSAVADQGYSRSDVLSTGYEVCQLLDLGVAPDGVTGFVVNRFADGRPQAGYYASLFGQYATYHLCPRHVNKVGPI